MTDGLYIGVDVGTGSARSALVTAKGDILRTASQEIQIWQPQPQFFEQSSTNIWNACLKVIKVNTFIIIFSLYFVFLFMSEKLPSCVYLRFYVCKILTLF